jgi:hypothetical protein
VAKEFVRFKNRGAFAALVKKLPAEWQPAVNSLLESVVFRNELEDYVEGSSDLVDHGGLGGLTDDDHSQYHNDARASTWLGTKDITDLGTYDHTSLTTIGTNTHAQIDSHINDENNDHVQYVLRSEWKQNGFEDASDVSLSWDDGTRTLTIQPAVSTFSYFIDGIKYTENSTITETIANEEGFWVFYIDAENSIASVKNPSSAQIANVILNYAIVAYVYWDATNNDGRLMYELHGAGMSPWTHRYAHFTQRAQWVSGMAIEDILTNQNGDDDEDAQLGIGAGAFDDEDIFLSLAGIATGDPIEIWYRDGADGNWRWTETTILGESFPVIPFSGGAGRLAWNEFTGGAWQQTEVGNTDHVLCHIFATNIVSDSGAGPKYIAVQGQAEYSTTAQARDGALVELNALAYGTLPLEEIVPVATIIYQTANGYDNAVAARTRTTDSGADYVDWLVVSPGEASATDHGGLSGLSDDDHQQYHNDTRADTWLGTKDITELATYDHTSLTTIGTNTHAQIDTHIDDNTGHPNVVVNASEPADGTLDTEEGCFWYE